MYFHASVHCKTFCALGVLSALMVSAPDGWTQSRDAELAALKKQVEELRQREAETRQQLEEVQRKLDALQAQPAAVPSQAPVTPLDRAVQEIEPPKPRPAQPSLASRQVGAATLRLIDISADILIAAGGASESGETLEILQGGGHDPRHNGFTLQALELSLAGAIDPYLKGEAHVVFFIDSEGETRLELEEAFLTTQSLPFGLQVEAGFFFSEFGLLNPTHPHAWDWVDQPIILSRFFGADGMRQAGIRLGWLTPLPWFSEFHVGVQNPHGETMVSFLANDEVFQERPIGGRPFVEREVDSADDLVYLLRWVNAWNVGRTVTGQLGVSALFGPNTTGPDGRTIIYGADLKVAWRPVRNFRGWPFIRWQTEFLQRHYTADAFTGEVDGVLATLPRQTLYDWGGYTQVLYGFIPRWAGGIRLEYATGSGESVDGRNDDPFRDTRFRFSPLLAWYVSEFAQVRLQYNYDWAAHLVDDRAHAVWLVLEGLFGAHPAHKF
jgi:hypothetical protein